MTPPAPPRRTIVVGDLHGCHDEALDLLDRLAVTSSDRVIFAGDLVDRGPKPAECVELAMQHEAILGNHEEKHLQQRRRCGASSASARRPRGPACPRSGDSGSGPRGPLALAPAHHRGAPEALRPDHARTRALLDDRHFAYLAGLPLFLRVPEANAVVVHAGVLPGRAIEDQLPHSLLHAQCIAPPATKSAWPSKAPPGWTFWTRHWAGPERVIFGHTVLDRPLVTPHAVGIDTGCVHGLALTAVVLPGWEFVSVPARRAWWGSKGDGVARYEVQDGVYCYS